VNPKQASVVSLGPTSLEFNQFRVQEFKL